MIEDQLKPAPLAAPASETPRWATAKMLPSWPVMILLAAAFLYVSPYAASDLATVPDSIEYAVGAQRFATLGHFNIVINGTAYPSRYTPWFPIFFLAPLYRLFPANLGIGIFIVLAFALLTLAAAYAIGKRLAGEWGAAAATIAVLVMPCFASYSRVIMSDIPFCAFGMLGAWLSMSMGAQPTRRQWLAASLIPALAFAIRPVGPLLLLPFLFAALSRRPLRTGSLMAALLCVPTAALALATCIYNQRTFGHWNCTGYQFWDPEDYEFPGVILSTRYLSQNLACLFGPQARIIWLLAAVGGAVLWRSRKEEARPLLVYMMLGALPITAFYLLYEFTDLRFQILLLALGSCFGAAGAASLLPASRRTPQWAPAACAIIILGGILWHHEHSAPQPPERRLMADAIAAKTPLNAAIITSLEAAYVEPLAQRGTARTVIAIDPGVEYATHYDDLHPMPRRAFNHPADWITHYANYLKNYGWQRVIPWTAAERPDLVAATVRSGRPVYLCLPPGDARWQSWRGRYRLIPTSPSLARLETEDTPNARRSNKL